jgi:hypothetical protein
MVASAPRYDPRILRAVRELDELSNSMAETCRRVGERAEELGLHRPSYGHLRRFIAAERARRAADEARRDALLQILGEAYVDAMRSRRVEAYEAIERVRDASG